VYLDDPAELVIWEELAPLAFEARTLTPTTTRAFVLLCRMIVLEAALAKEDAGGSNHRGVVQRVATLMLQFSLAPNGRPLYEAAPVEQPKTGLHRFIS
jgi:hypothetical protein